jgi:hypothetical protein
VNGRDKNITVTTKKNKGIQLNGENSYMLRFAVDIAI